MTLDKLNNVSRHTFLKTCEPLLEHCHWVLPVLADARPFMSIADIQNKLAFVINGAPVVLQKQALQQHPKLGVGKAEPGFSQSEQEQAGLSHLTESEHELFQQLNADYEHKMGYPFVVAVAGLNKTQILEIMQTRLDQSEESEWLVSLDELIKIAQIRVTKLVEPHFD